MPDYRRLYHPGGTYFFTVNLLDRSQTFLTDRNAELMECFESVNNEHPFEMLAYAVMPEHLHCIWILPEGDSDFSVRLKKIKGRFTRRIPRSLDTQKGRRIGERGIWQRRSWEHLIRDDEDLGNHIEYIHTNPVKHGHVDHPKDWPHSSWRQFQNS